MDLKEIREKIESNDLFILNKIALNTEKHKIPYIKFCTVDTSSDFPAISASIEEVEFSNFKPIDVVPKYKTIEDEMVVNESIFAIDYEVIKALHQNAFNDTPIIDDFEKYAKVLSRKEYYEGLFLQSIEEMNYYIYNKTFKYKPSFYIISSDLKVKLIMAGLLKPASVDKIIGDYYTGTINDVPTFVSCVFQNRILAGVNAADKLAASAYVCYKLREEKEDLKIDIDIELPNKLLIVEKEIIKNV